MSVIETAGLTKTFKGKRGRNVHALKDLSLCIQQGEVFGFLGPNGAGKSTTIKLLMGMISATSGDGKICGVPVSSVAARKNVGYLPENPSFFEFLTAREYLAFVGNAFAMDEDSICRETERVLKQLDLEAAADRPIRGYSKGMVQRLGLAQALLHDPDLYVLDEPMSGLDPVGRALVKDIIKELKRRGKTVFFSTHITADVEVVCDRVGVINKGQLMAVDTVVNILQSGVEGYSLGVIEPGGLTREIFVAKDEFKSFMQQIVASNTVIERIEPKRKDMEAFFLEIVGKD